MKMTPEQLHWVVDHNMQIRAGHRVQIYDAAKAWREDQDNLATVLEALKSLANEATGFLAMADPTAHGQTNLNCLQRRIDEARDAIKKAESPR